MEKVNYVAPTYPVQPMPAPAPMPMPMPAPTPAPVMHQPAVAKPDIHLHASYQHTSYVLPQVKAKACTSVPVRPYDAAGILVLFILLVIVARTYRGKC